MTIRDVSEWPLEEVPPELERSLFYSAVVLRKLIEDRKVTDTVAGKTLEVITYRSRAPEKSSIWRNMPGSVYFDLEQPENICVSIKELCSQIVHFFAIYWPVEGDGMPNGALICSYRKQDDRGFLIEFQAWSELLDEAADSWPTSISRSKEHGYKVE
ncbi:hypothetical protein [Rhodovulum sulfidophilum]|uniref:hypothetical protein n=1 Tax=Rhodovulum sulfidophilum TaxID=35806 RepID=UPI001389CBE6|nr:hypothetical protein [Rhodovulum sulfidophilum]NDK36857.1 hypothetical protein [Rhodovulum sulfidophilum]